MVDINKLDEMLSELVVLCDMEIKKAKEKNFFSKDLAEAASIILSVAYERVGNRDK